MLQVTHPAVVGFVSPLPQMLCRGEMFNCLRKALSMQHGLRKTGMITHSPIGQSRWHHHVVSPLVVACAIVGLVMVQASPVGAQATKKTTDKTAAAQKAGVSRTQALRLHVEQLEEQIVDLQVVIGTLESLAKPGGRSTGAAFTNGRAPAGGASLAAQVKALSAQVARLSKEVNALQQDRSGRPIVSGANGAATNLAAVSPPGTSIGSGFGATTVSPSQGQGDWVANGMTPDVRSDDEIGNLIAAPNGQAATGQRPAPALAAVQPQPGAGSEAPKAIYERAYGNLLQQDYAAAQAGFRGFLRKFPQHDLVPNALYWLGETYYVQQNYIDAAEAFDIVTAAYGASNKAPDSQLKRGMSLANLGKRSEACTVLRSLAKRYPNAPPHVKSKADSERQRVGCT